MKLEIAIPIRTNLSNEHSDQNYYIRLRRNRQYLPSVKASLDEGWTTVPTKQQMRPIYYWNVIEHNLFDNTDSSCRLYFLDPDLSQIDNLDQTNHMALNSEGQLQLLHKHLRHKGMKMNPQFFIARSPHQIEEALCHVKYGVVKVDNHEQRLIG